MNPPEAVGSDFEGFVLDLLPLVFSFGNGVDQSRLEGTCKFFQHYVNGYQFNLKEFDYETQCSPPTSSIEMRNPNDFDSWMTNLIQWLNKRYQNVMRLRVQSEFINLYQVRLLLLHKSKQHLKKLTISPTRATNVDYRVLESIMTKSLKTFCPQLQQLNIVHMNGSDSDKYEVFKKFNSVVCDFNNLQLVRLPEKVAGDWISYRHPDEERNFTNGFTIGETHSYEPNGSFSLKRSDSTYTGYLHSMEYHETDRNVVVLELCIRDWPGRWPNLRVLARYEGALDDGFVDQLLKTNGTPLKSAVERLPYFGEDGWDNGCKYHFEGLIVIASMENGEIINEWPSELNPSIHHVSNWIKLVVHQ